MSTSVPWPADEEKQEEIQKLNFNRLQGKLGHQVWACDGH